MSKLKPLYDSVREAEAEVQSIMQKMTEALDTGTEEGKQSALDLRPALDEAKKKAGDANQLYISARDAEDGNDPDANARKFVPVPGHETDPDNKKGKKEMTRAEFEALNGADRMSFMLADGRLIDE